MERVCEKRAVGFPVIPEAGMLTDECPVDFARKTLEWSRENLCGHSTYCRDGIAQLYRIVLDIQSGFGKSGDMDLMDEICGMILLSNDCDIAVRTAETVRRLVRDYADEWLNHVTRGKCTALRCASCFTAHILPESCTACGKCKAACPVGAIAGSEGYIHVIDQEKCSRCMTCERVCPNGSVIRAGLRKPVCPAAPVPVGSFQSAAASAGPGRRRRTRQREGG